MTKGHLMAASWIPAASHLGTTPYDKIKSASADVNQQ